MALPVAAIVCIVLACWVVVVFILFGLYKFLKYRGSCDCECAPCGQEGGESTCCKSVSESCNCCNPSLQGCLNSACPKKKISCVDIILCQCCAEPGQESCLVNTKPKSHVVLQYLFCCPCKLTAEHCLVKDSDHNWITKWAAQDQSCCQWLCSSVKCDSCVVKDLTFPSLKCECWKCSLPRCCQDLCCSKDCSKQQPCCQCLKARACLANTWLKFKTIFYSCTCSGEKFLCFKSSNGSCSCLSCSNQQSRCICCNSDKFNCSKCFTNGDNCVICCQPTKCPTYEVQMSERMIGLAVCPYYPENILCFSCSETEFIRSCCHYICFDRCGDSNFISEHQSDICTPNPSNCCSFLFELFVCGCQTLCCGCITTCENSVQCCGYSCLSCAQLLTCQASKVDSYFSCLCFDFDKIDIATEEISKTESEYTQCGCFVYKHEQIREPRSTASNALSPPSQSRMLIFPDGHKQTIGDNVTMSDSTIKQCFPGAVIAKPRTDPSIVQSLPNFKQTQNLNRNVHTTKSLHTSIPCDHQRSEYNSEEDVQGMSTRSEMNRHRQRKTRNTEYEDYESDESFDRDEQSYQDVRSMKRLQKQLISKDFHYVEDERDSDGIPRQGKSLKNKRPTAGTSTSKTNFTTSPSGILKARSKYVDDLDSDGYTHSKKGENTGERKHARFDDEKSRSQYVDDQHSVAYAHSKNDEITRERKRAHFQDDDPELYQELFPRQGINDFDRVNDRQTPYGQHTKRRERLRRQECVDVSLDLGDLNSDESEVTVGSKVENRISSERGISTSDDDDRNVKNRASIAGVNRNRGNSDRFQNHESHDQSQRRKKTRKRRKSYSNDRSATIDKRVDDSSSDDETPHRYSRSKNSHMSENGYGRSRYNGTDRTYTRDEEEGAVGYAKSSSKKKSVAVRMKEIRARNVQSESKGSYESFDWV